MRTANFILMALVVMATALAFGPVSSSWSMEKGSDLMSQKPDNYPVITLGGGCFWCLESEFRALDGVLFTRAGYMGGHIDNPTYKDVTTGQSGHAEVIEVTYDPAKTNYKTLLEFFMTKGHDPTQLNRQGVDVGPQYRSAIFYSTPEEQQIAEKLIADLTVQKHFKKPIVTTIEPAGTFWEAEDYHQQYYEKYEAENGRPHIRVLLKHKDNGKN